MQHVILQGEFPLSVIIATCPEKASALRSVVVSHCIYFRRLCLLIGHRCSFRAIALLMHRTFDLDEAPFHIAMTASRAVTPEPGMHHDRCRICTALSACHITQIGCCTI